ncbi:MAG TPA: type 1 glutamine amidotransferase domain-containing protein [Burkholderiaceae bacterium]|nr:type 1 glutamine amidotransferase domain-containing protein [Burkholderiaceae bacterium]
MPAASTVVAVALAAVAAAGALRWGLPAALRALGLHRPYRGPRYALPGRRALIVTTSHASPGPKGGPTGVFASEMTAPYYAFVDAGVDVDLASIAGGPIPIDPESFRWYVETPSDRRFRADPVAQAKAGRSLRIDDVDVAAYDLVFLAGGWGAAYDLGTSDALGRGLSRAWAAGRVVGGVCHGPLGLLNARDADGAPLVRGRRLTAVTDRQVAQLGIRSTPQHPERELRAAGAVFECAHAPLEVTANHVTVDGRLVTGQNQNAGEEAAQRMLEAAGGTPR